MISFKMSHGLDSELIQHLNMRTLSYHDIKDESKKFYVFFYDIQVDDDVKSFDFSVVQNLLANKERLFTLTNKERVRFHGHSIQVMNNCTRIKIYFTK